MRSTHNKTVDSQISMMHQLHSGKKCGWVRVLLCFGFWWEARREGRWRNRIRAAETMCPSRPRREAALNQGLGVRGAGEYQTREVRGSSGAGANCMLGNDL